MPHSESTHLQPDCCAVAHRLATARTPFHFDPGSECDDDWPAETFRFPGPGSGLIIHQATGVNPDAENGPSFKGKDNRLDQPLFFKVI